MTKPTETLQRIPLSKLYVAPENARFGSQNLGDLDGLGASIVEVGDLIDPVHAYGPDDDGTYGVWDGGRRLSALIKLAKAKKSKVPQLIASEGVPVLVCADKAAAMALSAATFVREAMDPVDEFLNYRRLFEAGNAPERIAAMCQVATPRVRQLLRLTGLSPVILDALKASEIALDVAEAFTLATDHARQEAVFADVVAGKKHVGAWQVRQAFTSSGMDPSDRWARFVGREAYEAAGGTFLLDLFSGRGGDGETWADGTLVLQLAQRQLDAMQLHLEGEGWAFVTWVPYEKGWSFSKGYTREPVDLAALSPEERARYGVFMVQGYRGEIELQGGWVKASKGADVAGAGDGDAAPDPALYGYGHKGHGVMTQVATQATAAALVANPAAAADAVLSQLVIGAFFSYADEASASRLVPTHRWGAPEVTTEGDAAVTALREAWQARLRPFAGSSPDVLADVAGLCAFLAALDADDKAQLLALSFARHLWAYEPKTTERHAKRWAHLGWMARHAGLTSWGWTPDAAFLKGASRDALVGANVEQLPGDHNTGARSSWAGAKKSELVEVVASRAAKSGWVPQLLRDLLAAPAAPAKAGKGKGKGKAQERPQEAPAPAPEPLQPYGTFDACDDCGAGAGEPCEPDCPKASDDEALSPALTALATGKAKPIRASA